MMLTYDGVVYGAGYNMYGQLGIDTSTYVMVANFVEVLSGDVRAEALSAGDSHSIVLKEDGSAWATGRNNHGQLGDGFYTDRSSFAKVVPPVLPSDPVRDRFAAVRGNFRGKSAS